jgi:diacylglycerol kinase family enzyme
MLPKALYGDRDWKEALEATLAAPVLQTVSAGQVAGERFYVAGIFGAPSLWARAREAVRNGDFTAALSHGQVALEKSFSGAVRYRLPTEDAQAQAVSVLCPLTSKALPADAPALEVAALNPDGAFSALKLALRGLVADWRDDPSVTVHRSASVALASDEPIPAILDGESVTLSSVETVTFVAQAFTAVRPAPDEA